MPKALTKDLIEQIAEKYGDSFYLLDSDVFKNNCENLLDSFRRYYPKTNIAYSYKTNYTPKLAKLVDSLGGYAEVVSEMEMEVALKSGVEANHIIWNGPVKNEDKVEELLLAGGMVNIDSVYEIENIRSVAERHSDSIINVGVRVNYDVEDGVLSRFGFDVDGEDFATVLSFIKATKNIRLVNLQAHFAKRSPVFWTKRAQGMIRVYEKVTSEYGLYPERLDIGGGIYGEMPDELRKQLNIDKYDFEDYASRAAKTFAEYFGENGPWLFIEPGTAVAANCMRYVSQIKTLKSIRGKNIASSNGSQKNISMSGLNPPMEVVPAAVVRNEYTNLDIAGYTCIESDYLYKNYSGLLGVGDYVVFGCCGSYSIGMKPPFILPNVAVVDISGNKVELVKRAETFEDVFHTFCFNEL